MFYTGVSSAEGGQVQRILSATSDDLTTWARTDVVVEADSAWYEKWTPELSEEHWRDPWIHWDEPARLWRMYLTARVRTGSPDGRGVIAQATSTDLASWSAQPPVTVPGDYRQMEVSQLVEVPTGYALLFCHGPTDNSAERLARIGGQAEGGMHLLFASLPEGPFVRESDDFFLRGAPPELYAARIVEHRAERYLLGWSTESNGVFAGGVSDPIRFAVDADNTIRLGRIAR